VGGGLLLDGTRSRQTGPLAERQSLGLGMGLSADANSTALQPLPDTRKVLHAEGADRVTFTRLDTDPVLDASLTYHGEFAENVRHALDAQPLSELEKGFLADYTRLYPGAELSTPLQVQEVPGHNALRVSLGLKLPGYLRLAENKQLTADFGLNTLISQLRLPDQAPRKLPLRLGQPGLYRHAVEFRFPEEISTRDDRVPFDHAGANFELHSLAESKRDHARFSAELVLLKDRLEPAEWANHRDQLTKIWPRLAGHITIPTLNTHQSTGVIDKLKAAQEDARRGRDKLKTQAQREAQAKLWVAQARLDSGRLPPKPRAQVMAEAGEQLDHLGRASEAASFFREAVALDPQSSVAHSGMSVNALLRGDDELAATHATQALKLAPGDTSPRYTLAYAHYYAGRPEAARDELLTLLKNRSEVDRGYATLWLHLATRRLGGDAVAATQPYQPEATSSDRPPAWPYPVIKLLDGSSTLSDALKAANADTQAAAGRLCELYFFLGQQQLANKQAAAARESFQKAVGTGVVEFTEHALAQRELNALATSR
jgi:lipoprotein NlpI